MKLSTVFKSATGPFIVSTIGGLMADKVGIVSQETATGIVIAFTVGWIWGTYKATNRTHKISEETPSEPQCGG